MRSPCLSVALVLLATALAVAGAPERLERDLSVRPAVTVPNANAPHTRSRGSDTLWIFDADFEDLGGDNAGWTTYDASGTPTRENHWAVDTIRTPLSRPYLGDRTWWCGRYAPNDCWEQPRGYGNGWMCILERDFPEVDASSNPGDQLQLEWDQRYAMQRLYDYSYVVISTNGGDRWATLANYSNGGSWTPGTPMNWGGTSGHPVLDLDAYAGAPSLRVRFRFESDDAGSSFDSAGAAYTDGAWQIDNIKWSAGSPLTQFWLDSCETGGDPSWVHADIPPSEGVGVTFERLQYPNDIDEGREFVCDRPPEGSYVMAAVDPETGRMVDGQDAWLMSPPIDVSFADALVMRYDVWMDCPYGANDWLDLRVRTGSVYACEEETLGYADEDPGSWYGGPFWFDTTWSLDPELTGGWLSVAWRLWNESPAPSPEDHYGGLFVNRMRVGVPLGLTDANPVQLFRDWFDHELAAAALDSAGVLFYSASGIVGVDLVVPTAGLRLPAAEIHAGSGEFWVKMPEALLVPGSEHLYYFEAVDGDGKTGTLPGYAPEVCYEFSVLPRGGDVLLVDDAGHRVPGERMDYLHDVQYYYEEALDILGYTWDRYDAPLWHNGAYGDTNGPDGAALDHYDTVFWVAGARYYMAMTADDADALRLWLEGTPLRSGRDLLIAGNCFSWSGGTVESFLAECAGVLLSEQFDDVDVSVYGTGSWDFPAGTLLARCPHPWHFDVVEENPSSSGTEVVAMYQVPGETYPAAVVRTDSTYGYQVTTLGFGIEYVADGGKAGRAEGIANRLGIIAAAMEQMEVPPPGPGTGVPGPVVRDGVSFPRPNPFNPTTTIDYGIATGGIVSVRLYDLSGKLVRTLLDSEVPAGTAGQLVWDGTDDRGAACASGVYFCKVQAPGFDATRKLVLLK